MLYYWIEPPGDLEFRFRQSTAGARTGPKGRRNRTISNRNPAAFSPARARGSGRTRMCSDGSEGRRMTSPTGLTDRVKGGQIWRAKSLPEKPAGAARLLFRMAPLRLAGRPVQALSEFPRQDRLRSWSLSGDTGRRQGSPDLAQPSQERGKGRPRAAHPRQRITPAVPSSLAGTSPAPGPRWGSRA